MFVVFTEIYTISFILECKLTDTASNNDKDRVWEKVSTEFNTLLCTGRSLKMLRSKWYSLKKTSKKEYATLNNKTHPPLEKNLGPIGIKVLEIVRSTATDTHCAYDNEFIG